MRYLPTALAALLAAAFFYLAVVSASANSQPSDLAPATTVARCDDGSSCDGG